MFWETFQNLCRDAKKSPTAVAKELGFSNAAPTHWKNGKSPNAKTLQLIADYFNVTTSFLLGETAAAPPDEQTDHPPSRKESRVVLQLENHIRYMEQTAAGAARLQLLLEKAMELAAETKKQERKQAELDERIRGTDGE